MTGKRVLIISYSFPPLAEPGALRIGKFVRFLPELGWMPIVVAPRWGFARAYAFEDVVPPQGVEIVRAPDVDPVKWLARVYLRCRRLAGANADRAHGYSRGLVFEWLRQKYAAVVFPDRDLAWIPVAVAYGLAVVRKYGRAGVHVMFSSFPTASNHCIALALKRVTGIPWVAELRDLWSGDPYFPTRGLRRRLDAALERKVIREADRIVTVSSYLKRVLEDRYGDRVRHKIDVITNGFDSKDLEGLPEISPHRKFTISYAGNFYGGKRDPTPFFQALRRLLDNGTVAAADLEVRLLGPEEPFARAVAEKWGLGGNVVFEGLLPYRDTLIQLRNSWALLLISLHGSYELSQKLFDYLACGRPIIAICPEDSEAASIIRAANAGYVIGNGDVSRLSDVISQLYRKWRAGVFQSYVDDELMRLFDRRSLTRRLANVMEEVVPG